MEVSKNSHLEQIKERMQKKLDGYPPYVLQNIYLQYKKENLTELKQKFESKDIGVLKSEQKSNLISSSDFYEILEDLIMITENQKEILTNSLVKDGKIEDGISYNVFMDSINVSSEENLQKIIKDYLLEYNDYLIVLAENINENNLHYKEIWIDVNKAAPKANKDGFRKFLGAPKFNTGKYQNIFNDEDKDYIF